ncbi:CAP domain-containing protein [Corynebacterium mendelii]|uniref:SCP domain-containing protein n=1 Tax=Corynebacterium mendelii TaxID=2765362 RepID=A0A939E0L1_9CORY|nr:CAP domain-containing protein [Corynebacterium mendelii]MBN9644739.1 hypothetical protein [Corynebacterium mendelii]
MAESAVRGHVWKDFRQPIMSKHRLVSMHKHRRPTSRVRVTLASMTAVALSMSAASTGSAGAAPLHTTTDHQPPEQANPLHPGLIGTVAAVVGFAAIVTVIADHAEQYQAAAADNQPVPPQQTLTASKDTDTNPYDYLSRDAAGIADNAVPVAGLEGPSVDRAREIMLRTLNTYRSTQNLPELQVDPYLQQSADSGAQRLGRAIAAKGVNAVRQAKLNKEADLAYDTSILRDWLDTGEIEQADWYQGRGKHAGAENIWWSNNANAPMAANEAWVRDHSAAANLLDPDMKYVGIGVYRDTSTGQWFFVERFVG